MSRVLIGNRIEGQDPFILTVNGIEYETYKDKSLMDFLRDDLKLKSVKNGCAQGVCGTCTILMGDKNQRACIIRSLSRVNGEVITIEGVKEEVKDIFVYAFGKVGAVQCGFCIPGMVMSGLGILNENPKPTKEEVKEGLKFNICRCTGYVKLVEGIMLAGDILRGDQSKEEFYDKNSVGLGVPIARTDVEEKVKATGLYAGDIEVTGMVHASPIFSPYPRAKFNGIEYSKALELEGVIGVLTAENVPNNKIGYLRKDWDVFIPVGENTRMQGDMLAVVVAEDKEILEKAKQLVELDMEELTPVSTIEEAMDKNAPKLHKGGNLCEQRHVVTGDADKALEECAHVVTHSYTTPFTEHAFLEPESTVAVPHNNGLIVYSSDQSAFSVRDEILDMFGWEDQPERVIVENPLVGGAFGGKEDASIQHIAALAAYTFNKPVRIELTRDESLALHPKRHAMEGTFTIGCDENGIFQAMKAEIYFDTGAYASLCGPVLERACTHSVGPYNYHNTEIHGYGYYTNNPPGGAFRGFGVCQSNYAMESNINLLAEKVGISPWEIRYRNAIKPGESLPNGQIADVSTSLVETLEAVKDIYYRNEDRAGIACAMKNSGVGVGLPDKGRARLKINKGVVEVSSGATDLGQGLYTVMLQMAAEALDLPEDKIKIMPISTATVPDGGATTGSRQTLMTGEAIKGAAEKLVDAMKSEGKTLEEMDQREFFYEFFDPTDKLGADVENPKSHVAYGFATHVVILDDEGKVEKVVAAHDSGRVVNPKSIEGQVEGGVVMGLGYALTEDFPLDNSVVKAKYGNIGLWRANMIPDIESIFIEKGEYLDFAFGSKGIGEIATIPTAAAVQGAYYKLDNVLRTEFPMKETAYSRPKKQFK